MRILFWEEVWEELLSKPPAPETYALFSLLGLQRWFFKGVFFIRFERPSNFIPHINECFISIVLIHFHICIVSSDFWAPRPFSTILLIQALDLNDMQSNACLDIKAMQFNASGYRMYPEILPNGNSFYQHVISSSFAMHCSSYHHTNLKMGRHRII